MTNEAPRWRLPMAVVAAQHLERVGKKHNARVGIAGSLLRRETAKNANFIFYRADGRNAIDDIELMRHLEAELGVAAHRDFRNFAICRDTAGFVYHFHFPEKRLSRSAK